MALLKAAGWNRLAHVMQLNRGVIRLRAERHFIEQAPVNFRSLGCLSRFQVCLGQGKLDISACWLAMFFQERCRLLRRAAGSLRIGVEQRGIMDEERVRILLLETLQYFQNTGGVLLALVIAGPQVVEIIAQPSTPAGPLRLSGACGHTPPLQHRPARGGTAVAAGPSA